MKIEFKPSEIKRLSNAKNNLVTVEKITGVPWKALAAIWWVTDQFKLSCKEPGKGLFGYAAVQDCPNINVRVVKFPRLSEDERAVLVKKGTKNFICAALMIAADLKFHAKSPIYPESAAQVVQETLKKWKGKDAVEAFNAIEKLDL